MEITLVAIYSVTSQWMVSIIGKAVIEPFPFIFHRLPYRQGHQQRSHLVLPATPWMVILVAPTDTSKAMGCTLGSSSLEIQRQWIIQVIISFHMVPEEYNSKAVPGPYSIFLR